MNTETTNTAATETRKFETRTCSRCAGSGQYSYCQSYGTTCFQCHGSGKTYTAKGKAAVTYLRQIRTVRTDQVQVGQRVNIRGIGKFNVLEITPAGESVGTSNGVETRYQMISLKGQTLGITQESATDVEIIAPTVAARNAEIIQALDYQDTLTVAGKPRKVRALATA